MDPNTGAAFENNQLELKPVAVTRWTARLVDGVVEQSYLDSRFRDDRRRVLVLMGFIAGAGILIVVGRLLAYLDGHGSLFGLWPPVVPVLVAALGVTVILRAKSPQAMEVSLLSIGVVVVAIRFTMMTIQPIMAGNWLPLMVTSLFVIYLYLPVRLATGVVFAIFYSGA